MPKCQITVQQPLDDDSNKLIREAEAALPRAYAPYSGFHVAAAILLDDGTILTGTNQENAAYPLCMCAERVVLYAKTSLHPERSVTRLAVIAQRADASSPVAAAPCGSCRQVISEFESRQNHPIEIIILTAEDGWIRLPSAQSLLPYGFSRSNLLGEQ